MSGECLEYLCCLHIPELDRVVCTPACEGLSIGAECHTPNSAPMSGKCLEYLSRLYIPEFDHAVCTPACEGLSIRTECHTLNSACMPRDRLEHLSRLYIPELYRVACTPAREGLSIGADCHTPNSARMPHEPNQQGKFLGFYSNKESMHISLFGFPLQTSLLLLCVGLPGKMFKDDPLIVVELWIRMKFVKMKSLFVSCKRFLKACKSK